MAERFSAPTYVPRPPSVSAVLLTEDNFFEIGNQWLRAMKIEIERFVDFQKSARVRYELRDGQVIEGNAHRHYVVERLNPESFESNFEVVDRNTFEQEWMEQPWPAN